VTAVPDIIIPNRYTAV